MDLNKTIIEIFKIISSVDRVKESFKMNADGIKISNLVIIGDSFIDLCGLTDIESKIITLDHEQSSNTIDLHKIKIFFDEITPAVERLNHIGVSYYCEDIEKEIRFYKTLLTNSPCNLYEEDSGNSFSRWFFFGDTFQPENPFFELVLNQQNKYRADEWIPHFQIDIDTSFNAKEIEGVTSRIFGEDFIKWDLDIPEEGILLSMGILGKVNNTKICLGLGTDIRDTKNHRKNDLREI